MAEIHAHRAEGIKLLSKMQVRPAQHHGVPRTRAALGASEYQKCVAHDSHPSAAYDVTKSEKEIRNDLEFDTKRDELPAITAFNNSKSLLAGIGCSESPAMEFQDTPACKADGSFCDKSCKMPVPRNCDPDTKNFGTCEPTVRALCDGIGSTHESCAKEREHTAAKEALYDQLDPGVPPCRSDADASFSKAAYAQDKYAEAHVQWVNAVNDATEVCTIGHALWVHNLGLYEQHYEKMVQTVDDLKSLCNNSTGGVEEFDINAAVAEASQSYMEPSHVDSRRRLVWWQQLCEPSIAAMEALLKSLEIASPQLMCFADTCLQKKEAEKLAFDALYKAYNKFQIALTAYKTDTEEYNARVKNKQTALTVVIQAYETFHPVQEKWSQKYDKDMAAFERFDDGADNGHCGLTDCQVQAVCSTHLKSKFETFVATDSCTAAPYSVDKICEVA